jgi:hypothetical protein
MATPSEKSLEARVQELEDIREINEVFFKWHDDFTGGFNGLQAGRLEALECLTDDATIEIEGLHKPGEGPRGRDEIYEYCGYYEGDAGPLPYVFQVAVAEKVEVDGDTAVQTSIQLGIFGFRGEDETTGQRAGEAATIGLYRRVNNFVRTPNGWKINKSTQQGGLTAPLPTLLGNLNVLPPAEDRKQWSFTRGSAAES